MNAAPRERIQIWVSGAAYNWLRKTRGYSSIQGRAEEVIEDAFQNAELAAAAILAVSNIQNHTNHEQEK